MLCSVFPTSDYLRKKESEGKDTLGTGEIGVTWKRGDRLRVRFLDGNEELKKKVNMYAQDWFSDKQYCPNIALEFDDNANKPAHIRISFVQKDGSWSYVGTRGMSISQDQPSMNFDFAETDTEEDIAWKVKHEFGHSFGLDHEHSNPKSKILWNETVVIEGCKKMWGWDEQMTRKNILDRFTTDTHCCSKNWDPNSVMMYPIPKDWTINRIQIPKNHQISLGDRKFLLSLYE